MRIQYSRRVAGRCGIVMIAMLMMASARMPGALGAKLPVQVYLPMLSTPVWPSPFGFQPASCCLRDPTVMEHVSQLGATWVRLDATWWDVQPQPGAPYDWSALTSLEAELQAASLLGLKPIVVVTKSPPWATIDVPHETSCGAVREDRFGDFAAFLQALAERYSRPPFNVHHWEIGNEPDVDPRLVGANAGFGCWGNQDDPYYGGEHYGRMLRVVTPRIKAADPEATVITGGLLLASPDTGSTSIGNPEHFLEGILRAGAAPFFDAVGFHSHASYAGLPLDYSGSGGEYSVWGSLGGIAVGKATFLRTVLARYKVAKPLFMTEVALGCSERSPLLCAPPGPAFDEAQADFIPRVMTRSAAAGVEAISWYHLVHGGWRSTNLLDPDNQPRPAYIAYQQFIRQIQPALLPPAPVDYGPGVEAFRFNKGETSTDIVWSRDPTAVVVQIPEHDFVAASTRDGGAITPTRDAGTVRLDVGFSPIYIHRR